MCDNCAGNSYPMGEYCQGCYMSEYRRNKNNPNTKNKSL